jgi:EmrB/QacA subfamily drug resistance transporter
MDKGRHVRLPTRPGRLCGAVMTDPLHQHADQPISPRHQRLIMALVSASLFMEILDGTVITTALPSMARSFGTTPVALDIGVSAYLLTVAVLVPASGWVADRYGARRVFAFAITLFTLASALCAQATGPTMFVLLRVLQGTAGALMVPVGRLVVMRMTPREKLVQTLASLIWPALIAPVIGPPLGGFITQTFGWRWIFYFNLPLGALALAACLWLIPDVREVARRFDWQGFVLSSTGIFALQLGLERAPRHPDTVALGLTLAGLALVTLVVRHLRRVAHPLIDLAAWQVPTFRAATRGGTVTRMAVNAGPFLLPLMLQAGYGFSAFHSGLFVLTLFVGDMTMKGFVARILRRFGHARVLVVNGFLCAASLATMALITPALPLPLVGLILVCQGLVRSLQYTALATLAFADIGRGGMSDANGFFTTTMLLSGAAGITLAATSVHLGMIVAPHSLLAGPGGEYRIAFLIVAAITALAQIEPLRLPASAGAALTR